MNRWELEQKIVIKALKDPSFKKKLLSNPKEALKEHGKEFMQIEIDVASSLEKGKINAFALLDKTNITVLEEKKDEWIIAIPGISTFSGELQDEDLKRFSAGGHCDSPACWA